MAIRDGKGAESAERLFGSLPRYAKVSDTNATLIRKKTKSTDGPGHGTIHASRCLSRRRFAVPLLDHFHPPLSVSHPWKGFHSAWANAIASHLNEVLPEGYYAIPEVPLGDQIEIDVASLERPGNGAAAGGAATAVWAPPRPRLSAPVDFTRVQGVEVHVFQDQGGPQLRAAIEPASPANKDRPRSRLTFAAKCVGYLERGVGLVLLDTVTTRRANLHAEIAAALEATADMDWNSPSSLAAVAYRTASEKGQTRVEAWPEPLAVGAELPTLPLWIGAELCLPLPLEASYAAACRALRITR